MNRHHGCHRTLVDIEKEVEALRGSSYLRRVCTFMKDRGKIDGMKRRLDEVLNLFKVSVDPAFKSYHGGDRDLRSAKRSDQYGDWRPRTSRRRE